MDVLFVSVQSKHRNSNETNQHPSRECNGTLVEDKMHMSVHILASTSVSSTLPTVQVPNLASTDMDSDYSLYTLTL